MTRSNFEKLVFERFGAEGDCPFAKFPQFRVFRHAGTRKWFAVVMTIPRCKLGLFGDTDIDIVNLKCGDEIFSSMLDEGGIFPAYHMAKHSWVSVALDGTCADDAVDFLLRVSFELTKK